MEREIETRLRENEVRYTSGRKAVVAALSSSDGPRSAAELHGQLGERVPLSSLYRSLSVLEESGVLVPHFGMKGVTRYELADWLQGHHHHLICVVCGAVEDVSLPGNYEQEVTDLVDDIGRLVSFEPIDHALEIEGRCSRCA
ncbi:MAG: Fur family transcriptional regulator [Acidimicrobiia bacterium]